MNSPVFEAKKNGVVLNLERDPHPDTTRYLAIEAPGLLVLFPKDGRTPVSPAAHLLEGLEPEPPPPDRDTQLQHAFKALGSRIASSAWTSSLTPFTDLTSCFRSLAAQGPVAEDVAHYLDAHPAIGSSIEMLFTSVSMSARAQWRSAPEHIRGVVARGWFLGRWLPTFLVLDGPILRFLNSDVFRRQSAPPSALLRAVRRFFLHTHDFMQLRHAFAHWSFRWEVVGGDSVIVGTDGANAETVRVPRAEADAFHILTFALIEALDDVFFRPRRSTLPAQTD